MSKEELTNSVNSQTVKEVKKKAGCEDLYIYQAAAYLKSYCSDLSQMIMYADEIKEMEPVDEDGIIAEMSLSGVSYEETRVQTSNIPDICFKIASICEEKKQKHDRYLSWLKRKYREKFERVRLVEQVIDSMPGQTRTVARLLYLNGMTYDAVSEDTGLGYGSINNERKNAIGFLAQYLERKDEDALDYMLG